MMGAAILGYGDVGVINSPLSLPNLALWFKSDAGTFQDTSLTTPAVADSDPVGGWQDQSGNGRHATQATGANQPSLKIGIQNGRPVLRSNGTSTLLATPSFTVGTLVTMFAVVSVNTSTNTGTAVAHTGANGNELKLNASTLRPEFSYNSGLSIFASAVATPSFHVWSGFYDGSNSSFLLDNVVAPVAPVSILAHTGTMGIFARTTPANFLNGDIGEIIYYNGLLTTTQQIQVYNYLKARWGTP